MSVRSKKLKRIISLICATAMAISLLPAITGSGAFAEPVPPGWIGSDDFLYVDDEGLLRNQIGEEVVLRGINLGGWMLQETWMCAVTGGASGTESNQETLLALESRFGVETAQELFDLYQDNYVTEDDFNFLKNIGVNCIRLPFWYRNFMSDEEGTFINGDDGSLAETINPGFLRMDWAIEQARQRGMYVMLDMHGVVGGQSTNHSTGTLRKNEIYTNDVYLQATLDLWKALAFRYKDNPVVCAYDLMNEPQNNGDTSGNNTIPNNWQAGTARAIQETNRVYTEMYHAIREVDPETICAFEAIWTMRSFPANDEYVKQWDYNVMYSMHLYDSSMGSVTQDGTIRYRVNELVQARNQRNVAVHIGELNNGDNNQIAAYLLYNENKISWNAWTYKLTGNGMGNWSVFQKNNTGVNCNVRTESLDSIKAKWGPVLRTFTPGYVFTPGVAPTTINSFTRQGMYNFITAGLSDPIPGVATGPAGGEADVPLRQATLPAPVLSVASQVFSGIQIGMEVAIDCDDPDADIYYTTDGKTPTMASFLYEGPLVIDLMPDQVITIVAKAFKDEEFSRTAKAVYSVKPSDAPVFGAGSCTGLIMPFSLKLYSEPGTDIYYSLNDGEFVLYTEPVTLSATTTVKTFTSGGGLSKSETVQSTYEFIGSTDIKMYHNFDSLTGVAAAGNTNIALNSAVYAPISTNNKSLAMTITSGGSPSNTTRVINVAPEGGGTFDATGYNYLIFWIYAERSDTIWMRLNSGSGAWTSNGNRAFEWVPIVVPRGGSNGSVSWSNNTNAFTNITIGEYNAHTYYIDSIYFAKTADASPPPHIQQICQAEVETIGGVVFTGQAIEPAFSLMFDGRALVLGEDYTVQFDNNFGVGIVTATITGIGEFKGTITERFVIEPKEFTPAMLTLSASSGTLLKPFATVMYGNILLVEGVDYTIAYDYKNTTVTVTGIGNYSGSASVKYTATPDAFVTKLNGNKNDLTITVKEQFADKSANSIKKTFSINNNAADTYVVGDYKVYVDTKGNVQIRDCRIVP